MLSAAGSGQFRFRLFEDYAGQHAEARELLMNS